MSYARRGNTFEVAVAKDMKRQGWTVGSMRHTEGPCDLLAVHPSHGVKLVECKTSGRGPYEHFGPADRQSARKVAVELARSGIDVSLWLVWKPPGGTARWLNASVWPNG